MDNFEKEFESVYKNFGKAIFRYVYLKTSNYSQAEDLTSETFLKFWKRLKSGQIIENSKALLYTIANGLVIDSYRKGEKKRKTSLERLDERVLVKEENFEEAIAERQQIEEIFTALQNLKKEYQEVVILHYVEDLTVSEVSEVLNKKENNVRVLLHRALQKLKEKL